MIETKTCTVANLTVTGFIRPMPGRAGTWEIGTNMGIFRTSDLAVIADVRSRLHIGTIFAAVVTATVDTVKRQYLSDLVIDQIMEAR
jgi:hypothetical protein